ncbi:MAG TPA: Asp-tRNA(Asn)/Glu-tRNA(Gln) amidotransferase subunit GatC [Vicinamibacterales bacterium]|nr:Asp-tRNA(Asn)/Glu-tRNA(Gln) amidotransferase subunit GatC [Vicinamibacterales bacterium]
MLASCVVASRLTRDEVARIAELARLSLSESEVALFTTQLAEILEYAEAVQQVDTSGIPPTSHAIVSGPRWRDDEPGPSLDRDEILHGAPAAAAGLFKVPKVL